MRPRHRRTSWRLSLFLAALCTVLVGLVYLQLISARNMPLAAGERTRPMSSTTVSDSQASDLKENAKRRRQLAAGSASAYAEIIERPLFMETRRPAPPVPTTVDTRKASLVVPEVLIRGIIVSETRRTALLKLPSAEKLLNVSEGDELEGWRIEIITPEAVVIRNGEEVAHFFLEDTITGTGSRLAKPGSRSSKRRSGRQNRRK